MLKPYVHLMRRPGAGAFFAAGILGRMPISMIGLGIVILIARPFGGYMTRVFAGERTFLSPLLRPVERAIYWCCGVDEKEEQHWLTYAVAMLLFSVVLI